MDESWLLYQAARNCSNGRVAEIGTHKGRSTIALALGIEARGDGSVVAIDPFDATIEGETGDGRLQQFRENLTRAGVSHRVVLKRGFSHDVAETVPLSSLDVLFIDGSHEYEDVLQDIDDWTPKMVDGGLILFNDPVIPEVASALRDRAAVKGSPLRSAALERNTLLTICCAGASWTLRDEIRRLRLRSALPLLWRWVRLIERLGAGSRLDRIAAQGIFMFGRGAGLALLPRARIKEGRSHPEAG